MFNKKDFCNLLKIETNVAPTERMTDMDWNQVEFMKKYENWGDPSKISKLLVLSLDQIRRMTGTPLQLTTAAYALTGHSTKSQHALGNAADWRLKDVTLLEMYLLAERFHLTGIGLYPNHEGLNPFMHTDVRPYDPRQNQARWIAIPNDRKNPENRGQWTYIGLNEQNIREYVL